MSEHSYMWGNVYDGVPTLEQTLAEIANERDALRDRVAELTRLLIAPLRDRLDYLEALAGKEGE